MTGKFSAELKDPWGNIHAGTTATAVINREEFGLKWNAALESGGVVVGKDVTIELQIELIKKVDAPASSRRFRSRWSRRSRLFYP